MKSCRRPALHLLREKLVPTPGKGVYFSIDDVESWVSRSKASLARRTLADYLHDLMEEGRLHGAGRGWYSFLPERATLGREPVEAVLGLIKSRFPLLGCSAWSTAHANPWMHHLIGNPVTVISVEKEGMEPVGSMLEDSGWKVFLNPRGTIAHRFAPGERTVVIRGLHRSAPPADDGLASPEGLLVELGLEAEALHLMDMAEFKEMATRLIMDRRVLLGGLLTYAERRFIPASHLIDNRSIAFF